MRVKVKDGCHIVYKGKAHKANSTFEMDDKDPMFKVQFAAGVVEEVKDKKEKKS